LLRKKERKKETKNGNKVVIKKHDRGKHRKETDKERKERKDKETKTKYANIKLKLKSEIERSK
jgi:hypothetical protein